MSKLQGSKSMTDALTHRVIDALFAPHIFTQALEAHKLLAQSKQACPVCGSNCRTVHPSVPYRTDGKYAREPLPPRSLTPPNLPCLKCGKLIGSSTYAKHLSGCMNIEKTNGKGVGTRRRKEVGYAEDSSSDVEDELAHYPADPIPDISASAEGFTQIDVKEEEVVRPVSISPTPPPPPPTIVASSATAGTKRKKEKEKVSPEKPPKKKRKTAKEKVADVAVSIQTIQPTHKVEEHGKLNRNDSNSPSPPPYRPAVRSEPSARPTHPMTMAPLHPFQPSPYQMWGHPSIQSTLAAPGTTGPVKTTERRERDGPSSKRPKKVKDDDDSDYVVSDEDSD